MIIKERNLIKGFGASGCSPTQQTNEHVLRDYSPAGFLGGDDNLHRFVGNAFPNATDPSGDDAVVNSELGADAFKRLLEVCGVDPNNINAPSDFAVGNL